MTILNSLEKIHDPLTATKSTNSVFSIISGDTFSLQIADGASIAIDIMEILKMAESKLPIAGAASNTLLWNEKSCKI